MEYEGHLEWNNGIKSLITTAAQNPSSLPSFPAALVGLYWPPNNRTAIQQYGQYMMNHTKQLYSKEKYAELLETLTGLKALIFEYHSLPFGSSEKGKLSAQIVAKLESCRSLFCDKAKPETTLTLFVQLAVLHIAYLWEQCHHEAELFGTQTASSQYAKSLREAIKSYYTTAQEAVQRATEFRQSLIKSTSKEGDVIGHTRPVTITSIEDAYEGGIGKWAKREQFIWYKQPEADPKDPNIPTSEEDMNAYIHSYTEYAYNHYSAIMQLNVLDVAELWTYLSPDHSSSELILLTRTIYDGPFGWFARSAQKPEPMDLADDVVPTNLEVWYREWVAKLKVSYNNGQTTGIMGVQDGGGILYQKHAFHASRRLMGVAGIFGKFARWSIRKLAWVFTDGKHGDRCGLRVGKDSMKFGSEIDRHHITEVIFYGGGGGLVLGYKLLPGVPW